MENNTKILLHTAAIPFQVVLHGEMDNLLMKNNIGNVGRSIAQILLLGFDVLIHNEIADL